MTTLTSTYGKYQYDQKIKSIQIKSNQINYKLNKIKTKKEMVKRELMYKFNRHSNWLFKETHFIFKLRIVLTNSNLQTFKLLCKTL